MIMAGEVSSGDKLLTKPGQPVDVDIELSLARKPRFVSRGGDKLASVAEALKLDFAGKVVLDVGSSTGGFTDYALQHGAARAYCVDVGTGQLAYSLRQDQRVVVMEQTDIRRAELPELADIALVDVSFISLRSVLAATAELIKPGGIIVAMAKPQFEAGKAIADKHRGVITDSGTRAQVLQQLRLWLGEYFTIEAEADSAVAGAKGNLERFFRLRLKH
jgi:23S rRNA (cytidine1920-2'-O)/16S rRNA (cytidine1409-2'-O)-methyltransferase